LANLGLVYAAQGQYEKALESIEKAVRLQPDLNNYGNLANTNLALQRFDAARQTLREAEAHQLDDSVRHLAQYGLAFLESDAATMADQQKWFAASPGLETYGLALASDTEAFSGRVSKARELTTKAVDSAIRTDNKEVGAIWGANAAVQQAAYGNTAEGRQSAAAALKLSPSSADVQSEVALALAMAGDSAQAESLAKDLDKRYPLSTQMQSLWLPPIRAQMALNKKDPAGARKALEATTSPQEFGQIAFVNNISCLYPTYIRATRISRPGKAHQPSRSFRKFSITAAWCGTAGRVRWRGSALRARMRSSRRLRKAPMPMPPASAPSPPTKISSRSGKTPTPTPTSPS
jgi:eukaryotic-like serine/threonine-protein kinase